MIDRSKYKLALSEIDKILSQHRDQIRCYQELLDSFPGQVPPYPNFEAAYFPGIAGKELLRNLFPNRKPKPKPPFTNEEFKAKVNALMEQQKREREQAIADVRLSPSDRLKATLRSEAYRKDFEFVSGLNQGDQVKMTQRLKEKWQLPRVLNPDNVFSEFTNMILSEYPTGVAGFLDISINIHAGKEELRKAFDKLLDKHLKHGGARSKKSKHGFCHWDIYDKKEGIPPVSFSGKKTFAEIAREQSGIEGDVNDNLQLNAVYQAVQNAYKQAEMMIKRVEAEAGPPFSGFYLFN